MRCPIQVLLAEQNEIVMKGFANRVEHYRLWGAKPNGRRVPILQLYGAGHSHVLNCHTGEGVRKLRESLIAFCKSAPW